MGYKNQLDNMTWSFSRLHAYEKCPYSFYLRYIEKRKSESNFYAENGKAMHKTFEMVFSGEIPIEFCSQYYADEFDMIYETEKESIMMNTYAKCIDYLCRIDDIDRTKYEVIGTEIKLDFKVGNYKFIGIADLVVKDKKSGKVFLIDHKQAPHFFKKDGTPLKSQSDNYYAYRHQMYLYCVGLQQQHSINVDKLVWHHFKDDGKVTVIPYNENDCKETVEWAKNVIEKIKNDNTFESVQSYLMCYSLCNFRNDCEYNSDDGLGTIVNTTVTMDRIGGDDF